MSEELLSVDGLRREFGLGRDLSLHLVKLLPHIKVGQSGQGGRGEKLLVRRSDVAGLMAMVIKEKRTLWRMVRTSTPESFQAWLNSQKGN